MTLHLGSRALYVLNSRCDHLSVPFLYFQVFINLEKVQLIDVSATHWPPITGSPPDRVEIHLNLLLWQSEETLDFSAQAYGSDDVVITGLVPRWHIAESSMATVDKSGTVQALSPGSAVLVAVMGGKPGYAQVTITESESISLTAALPVSTVLSGTSVPIEVSVNGLPPQDRTRFSSSNNSVATVDRDGILHAKNPGSATITVRAGGTDTSVEAVVIDNPTVSYHITQNRFIVRQGDVVRFRIRAVDENGNEVEGVYPSWKASREGALMVK